MTIPFRPHLLETPPPILGAYRHLGPWCLTIWRKVGFWVLHDVPEAVRRFRRSSPEAEDDFDTATSMVVEKNSE